LAFVLDGLFYPIRTFRLPIKVNSINCCDRQAAIIFSYSPPYSIIFWFYYKRPSEKFSDGLFEFHNDGSASRQKAFLYFLNYSHI